MGTLSQRDLEYYLQEKEFQDILLKSEEADQVNPDPVANETHDEDDGPTPEEAVNDADWLRETGFEFLIKAFDDLDNEDDDSLKGVMSTLTLAQAEAVIKRVDHVRACTIQKRKIVKKLPDVRDVFPSIKESEGLDTSLTIDHSSSTSSSSLAEESDYFASQVTSSMPHVCMVSDGGKDHSNGQRGNFEQARQSSVDEARAVFRSQSYEGKGGDPKQKKAHWTEKNPFLKVAHKQGYKFGHAPADGSGVKVLSYNVRSSMKHWRPAGIRRKSITDLFAPLVDEEEEELNIDDNNDYGFQVEDLSDQENTLPEAKLTDNPLGVTFPSDLAVEDQKKMRTLALIELTALFDDRGLTYSRRKAAKRKLKDGGVFGVALTTLVEEDRLKYPRCQTPVVFQKLLEEMERRALYEEGILRKTASLQSSESLKELVDSGYRTSTQIVDEALAQASPHDLSFLTKSFIRELPEPLLTNAYLDAFLQVTAFPTILEQLKALNLLVMLLSEIHRETLKRLLEFLDRVAQEEESNRMNAQNLSVIMAPNLFPPPRSRTGYGQEMTKKDLIFEVALATKTATVTKMLLKYKSLLWMVPPPLLRQIRDQNEEASRTRANKEHKGLKILQRKPKEETSKPRSNSDTNVQEKNGQLIEIGNKTIAVQLECDRRRVVTIIIDASTSVEGVLSKALDTIGGCGREKVNGRTRTSSLENYYYATTTPALSIDDLPSLVKHNGHFLFEVGGNIRQRKLDNNARVLALMKVNPDAEWMIKCGV